jgi:hypothetical protein
MYSLKEVRAAIDNEPLSNALYKMEQFARAHELTGLADWCKHELHGYDGSNKPEEEKNGEYRSLAVQWLDIYNRPVRIDPQLSFFSTVPMWIGVSELEGYAEKGTGWVWPKAIEMLNQFSNGPLSEAYLPPEQIQALLSRIRLRARIKLDENISLLPKGSVSSHRTPDEEWSWRKRSVTFLGVFGGIWLLLEPLFAVFGGNGPLSSWGVWRYGALLFTALFVVVLIEVIERRSNKISSD